MTTRITCVYDEGSQPNTSLIGAKGTSLLVDTGDKKVLFNVGLRDRYLSHNMDFLDIDPESIDAVVISQSNPTASSAINGLLKRRENPIDVYCPEGLYGERTFLSRSPGIMAENRSKVVFHPVGSWQEIVPGIETTPFYKDIRGYGETFMVVTDGAKVAILSGRCSCYPDALIADVKEHTGRDVKAFIGPVCLEKRKKPVAAAYADMLRDIPDLYVNHCVGRDGIVNLRVNLGLEAVKDFYVGDVYTLN